MSQRQLRTPVSISLDERLSVGPSSPTRRPPVRLSSATLEEQLVDLRAVQELYEVDPAAALEVWKAKAAAATSMSPARRSHNRSEASPLQQSMFSATLGSIPQDSDSVVFDETLRSQDAAEDAEKYFGEMRSLSPEERKYLKKRASHFPAKRLNDLLREGDPEQIGHSLETIEAQLVEAREDIAIMTQDIAKWMAVLDNKEKDDRRKGDIAHGHSLPSLEELKRRHHLEEFALGESIAAEENKIAELKATEALQATKIGLLTTHVAKICGVVQDGPTKQLTLPDMQRLTKCNTQNLRAAKTRLEQSRSTWERSTARYRKKLENLKEQYAQMKHEALMAPEDASEERRRRQEEEQSKKTLVLKKRWEQQCEARHAQEIQSMNDKEALARRLLEDIWSKSIKVITSNCQIAYLALLKEHNDKEKASQRFRRGSKAWKDGKLVDPIIILTPTKKRLSHHQVQKSQAPSVIASRKQSQQIGDAGDTTSNPDPPQ